MTKAEVEKEFCLIRDRIIKAQYENLNKSQQDAILTGEGPQLIIAGPGSGKTFVITYKIHYLIHFGPIYRNKLVPQELTEEDLILFKKYYNKNQNRKLLEMPHKVRSFMGDYTVSPDQILVITYTKAAAQEMKQRFLELEDMTPLASRIQFGTFHSVFFKIINSYYRYDLNNLIHEDQKYKIIEDILKKLSIEVVDYEEFIGEILNEMSLYKNDLISMDHYNPICCSKKNFKDIVYQYERFKEEKNLLDFDDMLIQCYKLLCENKNILNYYKNKFRYILIDEFQDINRVQYEVVKLLCGERNNIFVVGDDDQSIYYFRGARPEFLLEFEREFSNTKKTILNHNYRSTKKIIESSNILIQNNIYRHHKQMITNREEGEIPKFFYPNDFEEEAKFIAEKVMYLKEKQINYSDMAVIYRTNIQARALVDMFLDFHIPMYIRDQVKSIYDHWIMKDIEAYLLASLDLKNYESLKRIINKPKRYISKEAIKNTLHLKSDLLTSLIQSDTIQSWQIEKIEELRYYLYQLKSKSPQEAIIWIRKQIDYDHYIEDYSKFKNIKTKGFYEILDEIQQGAKKFSTIIEYLYHLQEVREEIKLQKGKKKEDAVVLTTMHGAKGLEFPVVFIVGAVEGIIPHDKSMTPSEVEEERRLFYVGITRAKDVLYVSCPKTRFMKETEMSRFVKEIVGEAKSEKHEFSKGEFLVHQKYGKGIIREIDGNIGTVQFNASAVIKRLDLLLCLKNGMITSKGGIVSEKNDGVFFK